MENNNTLDLQKMEDMNSIKLVKNTKGYGWEIKLFDKNEQNLINRIRNVDFELKKQFSGQ